MPKKQFQESMNSREAIDQELADSGISVPENYGEETDFNLRLKKKILGLQQKEQERPEAGHSDNEMEVRQPSPELIRRYLDAESNEEKLEILSQMHIFDVINVTTSHGSERSMLYMMKRLEYYEKLAMGQVTREIFYDEWRPNTGEFLAIKKDEPVSTSAQSLSNGILRDAMYSQMIGTPQMGALHLARKKIKTQTVHKPSVRGFESCIKYGRAGIGNYEALFDAYAASKILVDKKKPETAEYGNEHAAVIQASRWLARAAEYNDPKRTVRSSYAAPLSESIQWARLGEDVQKQLQGMRRKIGGIDLTGIGRFIGKSGDAKHCKERRRLKWELKNAQKMAPHRIGDEKHEENLKRIEQRLAEIEPEYQKTKSLAQKAIDLHFRESQYREGGDGQQDTLVDWINKAPFGLIKWADRAFQKGVSADTVFDYALARSIFPHESIDREMIAAARQMDRDQVCNVKAIVATHKHNASLGPSPTPTELCLLGKSYQDTHYAAMREAGYTVDALIAHPWLASHKILENAEEFPFDSKRGRQQGWCVKNAQYIPEGWQPKNIGATILTRLESGIDSSLHDATYWLKEFEVPDQKRGVVYKDPEKELDLVYSITDVPPQHQSRIPSKPQRIRELFSSGACQFLYEAVLPLVAATPSFDEVKIAVEKRIAEMKVEGPSRMRKGLPISEIEATLPTFLAKLKARMSSSAEREPYSLLVKELKDLGASRKIYRDTAQGWVRANGTSPRNLLTLAWRNRDAALADGCEDSPRAIKQWADLNGLKNAYESMSASELLPENFRKEDLLTYRVWLSELVRCYDGETAIKTVAQLKEEFNPKYSIPPMSIHLGEGWQGEVFEKADPRGYTIGHDTGCCMTLGGESESCITAGYGNPDCGFFALYRNGVLVAQSFLYTNPDTGENTIVCDNIETNDGRDRNEILRRYQAFWDKYLTTLIRRNPKNTFNTVTVGEGYTDIGLSHLAKTDPIPMRDHTVYTDAMKQRELHAIPEAQREILEKLKAQQFVGDWDMVSDVIMSIERSAFEGRGYDEDQLREEFENPNNIVIILKDGERIVGYSTGLPMDRETVYISSTALLPSHQGKGYVGDMMQAMDMVALRRGFTTYERFSRVDNGYADKLKRHYNVLEEGPVTNTSFGTQQMLRMEIPNHRIASSLEEAPDVMTAPEVITTRPIEMRDAAIVVDLEKSICPPDLCQGKEFFEDELDEIPDGDNASFFIYARDRGVEDPIGYVVAYTAESELGNDTVLYVADAALLSSEQKKGYGKELFKKIVNFAQSRQGMPIEFHARSTLSYEAVKASSALLEKLGYRITADEYYENYFADEGGDGESVHLLRLERVEKKWRVEERAKH